MPETVVMKFGGTSVGSTERMGAVAKRVVKHIKNTGDRVIVVVSAMSGETDKLVELARKVSGSNVPQREYHQLLASGEQASCALVAMAIEREGMKSHSMLAHQAGIKTSEVFGQNLIQSIDVKVLRELLDQGIVPVVAGFQGIDPRGHFTTLGRGGSDTTAVAIAGALDSCKCIIFTDIDGVYTALPSICKQARKLKHLTYEEMLELASSGAKVLQARSVALAHKFRVPLLVSSSFSDSEGTAIVEEYEGMEDAVVSGITCKTGEAKITLRNLPDRPGIAAQVFKAVGEVGVVVDMIVQSKGQGGKASISLTVPSDGATASFEVLQALVQKGMPEASVEIERDIAKLSVVGEGMRTHAGIAYQMFEVLGREGINIEMITTSEIKISVAIKAKYSELAVRVLHEFFIEQR